MFLQPLPPRRIKPLPLEDPRGGGGALTTGCAGSIRGISPLQWGLSPLWGGGGGPVATAALDPRATPMPVQVTICHLADFRLGYP